MNEPRPERSASGEMNEARPERSESGVFVSSADTRVRDSRLVQAIGTPPVLRPTEAMGNAGEHSLSPERLASRREQDPTEDDVLGPYYRALAPYRGKVTPPLAKGEVLVISGRV
jgi:hypothetical protein